MMTTEDNQDIISKKFEEMREKLWNIRKAKTTEDKKQKHIKTLKELLGEDVEFVDKLSLSAKKKKSSTKINSKISSTENINESTNSGNDDSKEKGKKHKAKKKKKINVKNLVKRFTPHLESIREETIKDFLNVSDNISPPSTPRTKSKPNLGKSL